MAAWTEPSKARHSFTHMAAGQEPLFLRLISWPGLLCCSGSSFLSVLLSTVTPPSPHFDIPRLSLSLSLPHRRSCYIAAGNSCLHSRIPRNMHNDYQHDIPPLAAVQFYREFQFVNLSMCCIKGKILVSSCPPSTSLSLTAWAFLSHMVPSWTL